MIILKKEIEKEQKIVASIISLINDKYLDKATITLQENKSEKDSIIIVVENNPWRNGVIKGDLLFSRVKTGGKVQYVHFKKTYSHLFDKLRVSYTSNKSERDEGMIRIALSDFCNLLDHPTEDFIKSLNYMYLNNISFSEFGCCSKYADCEKAGKCLHTDQLYATACQYQKLMKRTGKFENS